MTVPANTADPVLVLEACPRERSGGSIVAALRDVGHMACPRGFDGSYEDAYRFLAETGRYRLVGDHGSPVTVQPAARDG